MGGHRPLVRGGPYIVPVGTDRRPLRAEVSVRTILCLICVQKVPNRSEKVCLQSKISKRFRKAFLNGEKISICIQLADRFILIMLIYVFEFFRLIPKL